MKKGETTNVDHTIKACLATIEAQMKEFNPMQSAELSIREHLKEYPNATIKVEKDGPKEIAARKAKAAAAEKLKESGLREDRG